MPEAGRYRDAQGRFRKLTDEERWPNARDREVIQRTRALWKITEDAWRSQRQLMLAEYEYLNGKIWVRGEPEASQ